MARPLCSTLALMALWGCDCGEASLTELDRLLVVDVERLSFEDTYVGATRILSVRLTSAGTAPVSLHKPTRDGDAFVIQGDAPDVIAAGGAATIDVAFAPEAAGSATGTLRIENDAQNRDHKPVLIRLDGTGLAPLDCDDDNDCTQEFFHAESGECVRADRIGPCDDHNACTDTDRCDDGQCVGDAITCADDVACTQDACDAAAGCVFVPQHDRCADDDPCSLDICDVQAGCSNPPAPDGTSCGSAVPCDSLHICILHQCTEVPIPEGTPCSDGDVCTTQDRCTDGSCQGQQSLAPPELVAESVQLKTPILGPALVVGGRLVTADDVLKILSFDDTAPMQNSLIHDVVGIAADDGTVAVAQQRSLSVGAQAPHTIDVAVFDIDSATSLATVSLPGALLNAFYASPGRAWLCVDGNLFAVHLDSLDVDDFGTGQLTCESGHYSSVDANGGLALEADRGAPTDSTPLRLIELTADGPVLHPLPRPAGLIGELNGVFFHGGIGVLQAFAAERVVLVDARNLQLASATTTLLPSGTHAVALHDGLLYFSDLSGVGRLDINNIEAPVLDAWHSDFSAPGLSGLVASYSFGANDRFLIMPWNFSLDVVDTVLGGTALPMPFLGSIGTLVADRPGLLIGATEYTQCIVQPPFVQNDVRTVQTVGDPVVLETPSLTAWYSPPVVGRGGRYTDETAPLRSGLRMERRRELRAGGNVGGPGRIRFDEDGTAIGVDPGPPAVAFPEAVNILWGPAARSCVGAALGVRNDVDCDPFGCPANLFVVSICNDLVDVVTITSTPLQTIHEGDLAFTSSIAHGGESDLITFMGTSSAALVSLADPLAPTVIEAEVPELDGASFASAGADQSAWLLLVMQPEQVPHVILFDTASGSAVRRAEWDLAQGAAIDIRRRVLAVSWPRAFVSDWTPSDEPYTGHRVDIYDISVDPPVVADTITLSSEPTGLSVQDGQLVVTRADGISVISPPCGP